MARSVAELCCSLELQSWTGSVSTLSLQSHAWFRALARVAGKRTPFRACIKASSSSRVTRSRCFNRCAKKASSGVIALISWRRCGSKKSTESSSPGTCRFRFGPQSRHTIPVGTPSSCPKLPSPHFGPLSRAHGGVPLGHGGAYIAHDTRRIARSFGLTPIDTPVCSPRSNGIAESFVCAGRTGSHLRATRSKRMTHANLEARDVPAPSELSGGGFFGSRRP